KTLAKDGISFNYHEFVLTHPSSGKNYQIFITENPFNPSVPGSFLKEGTSRTGANDVPDPALHDASAIPGKNYALLLATNDYDNYPDLLNPLNDANTIAAE